MPPRRPAVFNVQYSVSYHANGANGGTAPSTQTKEKGVSLVLAMNAGDPLLYKTGHTFAGWNTAADGSGTSYAECATYTHNAPLTLYAHWAANPTTYTVTLSKNGTTGTQGQVYFTTNASTTFGSPKVQTFTPVANDSRHRTYRANFAGVSEWIGTLKRLRVDPEQGAASGTFSILRRLGTGEAAGDQGQYDPPAADCGQRPVLNFSEGCGEGLAQFLPDPLGLGERVGPGHMPRALVSGGALVTEHRAGFGERPAAQPAAGESGKVRADELRVLVQHSRVHPVNHHAAERPAGRTRPGHEHGHVGVRRAAGIVAVRADPLGDGPREPDVRRFGRRDGRAGRGHQSIGQPGEVPRVGPGHDRIRGIAEIAGHDQTRVRVGGRHENRRERQAGFIRDALPDPECEIAGEIDQIVREEERTAGGRPQIQRRTLERIMDAGAVPGHMRVAVGEDAAGRRDVETGVDMWV
jgi:uncharacterized repeat protein (TIGR02543 family)